MKLSLDNFFGAVTQFDHSVNELKRAIAGGHRMSHLFQPDTESMFASLESETPLCDLTNLTYAHLTKFADRVEKLRINIKQEIISFVSAALMKITSFFVEHTHICNQTR